MLFILFHYAINIALDTLFHTVLFLHFFFCFYTSCRVPVSLLFLCTQNFILFRSVTRQSRLRLLALHSRFLFSFFTGCWGGLVKNTTSIPHFLVSISFRFFLLLFLLHDLHILSSIQAWRPSQLFLSNILFWVFSWCLTTTLVLVQQY